VGNGPTDVVSGFGFKKAGAGGGRKIVVVSNVTARQARTGRLLLPLRVGGIRYPAHLLVTVRVLRLLRHRPIFVVGVALTDK
jgi:hypothetical protein